MDPKYSNQTAAGAAEQAVSTSEVAAQVNLLEKQLEFLNKNIVIMDGRLESAGVLHPTYPEPGSTQPEAKVPQEALVPLADQLRITAARVQRMSEHIETLISRMGI